MTETEAAAPPRTTLKAYACGLCGEEFTSNCSQGDIGCPGCEARRCPHCGTWYSELEDVSMGADTADVPAGELVAFALLLERAEKALTDLQGRLDAEAGQAVAAERERVLAAAENLKITLARPGNGPAQRQETEVVPLAALRDLLAPGRGGTFTPDPGGPMPRIVCLCGSTRFVEVFNHYRKTLTEAGEIVLSIEVVTTQAREDDPQHADPALKVRLDELHKRKIDLADYCLIVSKGGYLGESTRSEIAYAVAQGKPVQFMEAEAQENWNALAKR